MALKEALDGLQDSLKQSMEDAQSQIGVINIVLLATSFAVLGASYMLIYPQMSNIKTTYEKLLLLIARITEREAEQQIFSLHLSVQLLQSETQAYLKHNFSNSMLLQPSSQATNNPRNHNSSISTTK